MGQWDTTHMSTKLVVFQFLCGQTDRQTDTRIETAKTLPV